MVSPEILRRYPFFAGLSIDRINKLAKVGEEKSFEEEHYFFYEDQKLTHFYLNLEGTIAIVLEVPKRDVEHKVSEQFSRTLLTKDIIISTIGPGEMFGWSGLVPPHKATASAKAQTDCRVITFDCDKLLDVFVEDCEFGYTMAQ
ncbi:MAG: cyclic nucleotide-binding domain-containing protein, partial [Anaerolineales bacterium]